MDTYTPNGTYPTKYEQDTRLRQNFLADPFVFVLPPPKFEWWQAFFPESRVITGKRYFALKRFLDVAMVIFALPILLPILGLVALAIKVESPGGPVMFTQERTGRGGRRFKMYKFRTMVPNAEELKRQFVHLNILKWPDFKIPNDPRITKVGKFLRKTSLDELPQILNILRGDMSLVGPRPTSFDLSTYTLWHTERLDVAPGLTGLWQINGRGEMEFDDRVRLDVAYIERRSIYLDLVILLKTVTAVLERRGAV